MLLLLFIYVPLKSLLFALAVTATHFILDLLKSRLNLKKSRISELPVFVADQALHLLMLFILCGIFDLQTNAFFRWFVNLFSGEGYRSLTILSSGGNVANMLTYLIIYLYVCLGGAVVVRKILDINQLGNCAVKKAVQMGREYDCQDIASPQSEVVQAVTIGETSASAEVHYMHRLPGINRLLQYASQAAGFLRQSIRIGNSGAANTGRYIGILERIIIMTLCINNAWPAIGLVFTAKSIVRFKEFDDPDKNRSFAEYYLIGTLTSTMLAILGGAAVKAFT